jgi:ankyrin repeat protein
MKNRIVVAVTIAICSLSCLSCWRANDEPAFFELVKTATPQRVQDAIIGGADVKAKDRAGATALMFAAGYNQNPEVIATLLKAGADVNAKGMGLGSALMYAAMYNQNVEVFATLLKAGADIEAKDMYSLTVLMHAAKLNRNPDVITTILNAGADGKMKDDEGKTAFDYGKGNEKLKGTEALRRLEEASK